MNKAIGYSQLDEQVNTEFYQYFLDNNEDDGWDDNDKYGNFHKLVKVADHAEASLDGASVLDVGCGTGDMASFLQKFGISPYTGIDIFKPSIDKARNKHQDQTFIAADFLTYNFKQKFDFVFSSGALSTRLRSDNYKMIEHMIQKMWRLSKKGIAFNFLIEQFPGEYDDYLYFYKPPRVESICRKIAPKARLIGRLSRAGEKKEFVQEHIYLIPLTTPRI